MRRGIYGGTKRDDPKGSGAGGPPLLEGSGLQPKGGTPLAAAAIRGLILTVSHQEQIGEAYPQVLRLLVCGACRELFHDE